MGGASSSIDMECALAVVLKDIPRIPMIVSQETSFLSGKVVLYRRGMTPLEQPIENQKLIEFSRLTKNIRKLTAVAKAA